MQSISFTIKRAIPSITRTSFKSTTFKATTFRTMSTAPVPNPQEISAAAKTEGGPTKGSESAHMQSQLGKEQNFEATAQKIGTKMQTHPEAVTSEDASHLKSAEARAIGQSQPPKDSISSEAQRLASKNERESAGATTSTGPLSPEEQSHLTRERNFQTAAAQVGDKMANNPEQVTKEDGDMLHSREQKAHGHTDKGGIAAQAQHLAAENAAKVAQ